ncbi:CBS domain-containing protein [Streptomyces sp. HPF1205]|uniref:CBS domain-containing protein n=1 Tax=Streptomyces sp. HPF1205 TaxID=2873262 RepID=UPI0021F19B30
MVADLMTAPAVCVRPGTGVKDIALDLAEHDITAVPVVDDLGHPLGVISEADLMAIQAARPDPAGHLSAAHLPPGERARARATTAAELMTSPAVVARPQWSVVEAARTMARHHVKRLPVVDDAEQVVGVVSRSDLLRVFLRADSMIRQEITTEILTRTLRQDPDAVSVDVTDGRVRLSGAVDPGAVIPVAVRLCESVDGVVGVENDLYARSGAEADTEAGDRAGARADTGRRP